MDDIIAEFIAECRENLVRLDEDLLQLEQHPDRPELQSAIFRTLHTIKGSCGLLGLVQLEAVTHAAENLLSKVTLGQVAVSEPVVTALLGTVDAVRAILGHLEADGTEGEGDYGSLKAQLQALQNGEPVPEVAPAAEPDEPPAEASGEAPGEAPGEEEPIDAESAPAAPTASADDAAAPRAAERHADANVRVDVRLLDSLMNLVGELVLARNQVVQYASTQEDAGFLTTSQHLNLVTTELQEGVMKTRMQPIGNVWRTIPRLVRDVTTASGKRVRVEMEGQETELDRTIIEAIKDPLTHLVRNAVDHGIGGPADRVAAGKPEEGTLRLRAFHEGGQVTIEIADDGRGIDVERVKARAVERGVVGPEEAERLTERDAFNLIFRPGFSTAEKVTNISGRGVGMDVVKTNIERIGGVVDVQSAPGAGTTFRLKIPLTLAIIPALVVTSARARYAIPQSSLLELVMLEGEAARTGVEFVHDAPVYRLRGRILPLVYLRDVLGHGDRRARTGAEVDEDEVVNIVVLQAEGRAFGLVVDAINDTEEIVVKPLSTHLKGLGVFAGATIMGDGHVALILDPVGLVEAGRVANADAEQTAAGAAEAQDHERQSVLLLESDHHRFAVPLERVARLEEFEPEAVEWLGADRFVQYRGDLLPLLELEAATGLPARPSAPDDLLQVVVLSDGGATVGLVVGRIADVVDEEVELKERSRSACVLGSAVLQGRATDVLDVAALVHRTTVSASAA